MLLKPLNNFSIYNISIF